MPIDYVRISDAVRAVRFSGRLGTPSRAQTFRKLRVLPGCLALPRRCVLAPVAALREAFGDAVADSLRTLVLSVPEDDDPAVAAALLLEARQKTKRIPSAPQLSPPGATGHGGQPGSAPSPSPKDRDTADHGLGAGELGGYFP